jgi:hypothetical protein
VLSCGSIGRWAIGAAAAHFHGLNDHGVQGDGRVSFTQAVLRGKIASGGIS